MKRQMSAVIAASLGAISLIFFIRSVLALSARTPPSQETERRRD
jgi:hypothetical protein